MGGQEMEKEENEGRKLEELVKRLEEAEEKQLVYARRQMICAALAAVSCFLLARWIPLKRRHRICSPFPTNCPKRIWKRW